MSRPAQIASLLLLVLACFLQASFALDVHQGCYYNCNMGRRAMPFMAASLLTMTPELCSRMAKTRFASAYGLEYGRECWLGEYGAAVSHFSSCSDTMGYCFAAEQWARLAA
jgi:hypothetical protein